MRRLIIALAAFVAALVATAGTAFAADPVQSATQSASTGQDALAASSATQVQPSNQNISVRVLSPGDDGAVTQSNVAASSANASNTATTTQSASQALASGCGCAVSGLDSGQIDQILPGAIQAADGSAQPASAADAPAADPNAAPAPAPDAQAAPAPDAKPAPAPDAKPAPASSQANDAASSGTATNAAPTTQTATQSVPSGSGVQSSQQDASTEQGAVAASSAEQVKPSNQNISVRILSPGDSGSVSQSNAALSSAGASNTATTSQSGTQSGGGSGVQSSTQNADTHQAAVGLSSAKQIEPENSNISVRILSPGNDGSVSQSNTAASSANATNDAPVTQSSTQSSGSCGCEPTRGIVVPDPCGCKQPLPDPCGCKQTDGTGTGVQAIGQSSNVGQLADAASSAVQVAPSNSNDPVRIGSYGNDGTVKQSNLAASSASSTNDAPVTQTGTQTQAGYGCGCSSGPGVQAIGQSSKVGQLAGSLSSATQIGASNESSPVRIDSPGGGGALWQSNTAASSASSTNTAPTSQSGTQAQSGAGVQAIGQKADTWQAGFAVSSALQLPGRSSCGCGGSFGNTADPVRVSSPGGDGKVAQSNDALSRADASNTAVPTQTATQTQRGSGCGCGGLGVQATGQQADTGQLGVGLSSADQIGAANRYQPYAIWSRNRSGKASRWADAASGSTSPRRARIPEPGTMFPV
jgi:hypothetical protein